MREYIKKRNGIQLNGTLNNNLINQGVCPVISY